MVNVIKKGADLFKRKKKRRIPNPARTRLQPDEELRSIIEKEIKKAQAPREKKQKPVRNLEEIAKGARIKVKKFLEKEGISYQFSAAYHQSQQLDYEKLFSYLGQLKTQQSLYGTYAAVGGEVKLYSDDGFTYKLFEKVMFNKKIGMLFGNYSGDGSFGSNMTEDITTTQREKWNLVRKFNSSFAMSMCMYDIVLG